MKHNRLLKLGLVLVSSLLIVILIKQNVTTTKEKPSDPGESISSMALEKNSALVKKVFDSLILLSNRNIDDEFYRFAYFNVKDKNELSQEEKLYIAFESLYKNDDLNKENIEGDMEILRTSSDRVKEEIVKLFKDDSFDPVNVNYKSSSSCGIVDYLYTGTDYELKFKRCDKSTMGLNVSKLESAVKDGNYIRLTIKSMYAVPESTDSNQYIVKNYNNEEILATVNFADFNEDLLDQVDVKSYVFSFELKGDDYYLVNIKEA